MTSDENDQLEKYACKQRKQRESESKLLCTTLMYLYLKIWIDLIAISESYPISSSLEVSSVLNAESNPPLFR